MRNKFLLGKKILSIILTLGIIASFISVIPVTAATVSNGMIADFDTVGSLNTINADANAGATIESVEGNSVSGNALKYTFAQWRTLEIKAPAEGFQWYGDGIKFWYKSTDGLSNLCYIELITSDGKYFHKGGAYNVISSLSNTKGEYITLNYSEFTSGGYASDYGVTITEEDIGKITTLKITVCEAKWGATCDGTVYFDNFEVINPYTVVKPNDVNGDGKVNILDLVRLKKILAGVSKDDFGTADIDGDGNIQTADLVTLRKVILAL